jgi:signal peptidase I
VWEGQHNAGFLHDEQKAVMKQNQADPRNSEHALKCELAAQVLRSFGMLRLEVTGLSMLPSVWPGDTLFIQRCDMRDIAAGDMVLFARRGKLVAHRVICKTAVGDQPCAITQGDGLLSPDEPVSPTALLGSVRHILRAGEYVETDGDWGFCARAATKLIRRFAWVARFLASIHRLQGDTRRRETVCKN